MLHVGGYTFKRAETETEFDQVHALNYRTFVAELGQYPDAGDSGRLVDKFHHKNTYFIALRDDRVVGMVSVHGEAPFSIADRLADPSILERPDMKIWESRLLAVDPDHRNSIITLGLFWVIYRDGQEKGITHVFISGVQDRLSLYESIGFERMGPGVRSGKAVFVPMMAQLNNVDRDKKRLVELWVRRLVRKGTAEGRNLDVFIPGKKPSGHHTTPAPRESDRAGVCLLPGPVCIAPAVHEAFHRAPIYHRGQEFLDVYEGVRAQLARMVQCRNVAILNGSGTLANEVIAATLSAEPGGSNGLILVNGEFGQRLVRQASRFGLTFDVLFWPWGQPWDLDEVARRLDSAEQQIDWVWGVHQESSTGVLNDLAGLIAVTRETSCKVCVDCISSLGATPLDLSEVYIASGATGKALGSYAGASLLFADRDRLEHLDMRRVPSYFDLPASLRIHGPRFTFPSSTLCALEAALREFATPEAAQANYDRYHALGVFARQQLRAIGLPPLADESCAAPVITTFAPPADEASEVFVARCAFWGYAIGGSSAYLQERRLVQIATMGAMRKEQFAPLFDQLRDYLTEGAFESGGRQLRLATA